LAEAARLLAAALTAGAVVWLLVLAFACAAGGPDGSGGIVYTFAAAICHQRAERSFAPGGIQFPVCARCIGLYAAGAAGALAAWVGSASAVRRSRPLLLLAAIPTAITIPVEWLHVSNLSNGVRFAAALPLGAAAGWVFVQLLRSESRTPDAL
jgi:uncharacterized membrane protein